MSYSPDCPFNTNPNLHQIKPSRAPAAMDKELFPKNPEFLSSYSDRPIVLSPPPMDQSGTANPHQERPEGTANSLSSALPKDFIALRQQLVGYNLQQEFEALKADLDLDLSMSNNVDENDAENTAGTSSSENGNATATAGTPSLGNRFLSPRFSHGLGPSLLENFSSLTSTAPMGHLGTSMAPGAGAGSHHLALLGVGGSKLLLLLPQSLLVPSRPQLVNDFLNLLGRGQNTVLGGSGLLRLQASGAGLSFYADLVSFTSWMENLSPQDLVSMLDHWCNNLPFDILLTMKSRLELHLNHPVDQAQIPPKLNYGYEDLVANMENTSLGRNHDVHHLAGLAQPKPKANDIYRNHLFQDMKLQRPKLADPHLHNRFPNGAQLNQGNTASHLSSLDRARSPTSHLHEKTNFLQLAAASNSPLSYAQHAGSPEESYDLNATLKLGALATINSRVALDSNRKGPGYHQQPLQDSYNNIPFEEQINRQGNSSSVPVQPQKYSLAAMGAYGQGPSAAGLKMKKEDVVNRSKNSTPVGGMSSSSNNGQSSMPSEIASIDLLNNIPAWLKLLRLHKYTDCLKDTYWKDLIELSDEELEKKGVKALGARRKLLKAFDAVKQSRT